jgi:hypothetical protein
VHELLVSSPAVAVLTTGAIATGRLTTDAGVAGVDGVVADLGTDTTDGVETTVGTGAIVGGALSDDIAA